MGLSTAGVMIKTIRVQGSGFRTGVLPGHEVALKGVAGPILKPRHTRKSEERLLSDLRHFADFDPAKHRREG